MGIDLPDPRIVGTLSLLLAPFAELLDNENPASEDRDFLLDVNM